MAHDASSNCQMIQAEINANNMKVQELADEKGMKVAQNVAAGVAGLVVWPLWFATDFKGAADKDVVALQAPPTISDFASGRSGAARREGAKQWLPRCERSLVPSRSPQRSVSARRRHSNRRP